MTQVLENRLHQAEQRFGETIARNRELRSEIESMNKQRETYEQVLSGEMRSPHGAVLPTLTSG